MVRIGNNGGSTLRSARMKAAIAKQYGVPLSMVLRCMHWAQRLTILEMSSQLGISRITLNRWMAEHSIPTRSQADTTRMKMAALSPEQRQQRIASFHAKAREDGWSKHKRRAKGPNSPCYKERVPQPCKWCGHITFVPPSFVGKRNMYCCAEHKRWWLRENWRGPFNPQYKGGSLKREYCSKPLRKYILARDRYTCFVCKRTAGPFDIHHCVSYADCLAHEAHNLVTLCRKCHRRIHGAKTTLPMPLFEYVEAQLPSPVTRKQVHQ